MNIDFAATGGMVTTVAGTMILACMFSIGKAARDSY
jgi:hypothetical protein